MGEAKLQGADLSHTDLTSTTFEQKTDLRGAFLYAAEIKNAKGLQYAQISGKNTNEKCIEEFIADNLNHILNSEESYKEALEEILTSKFSTLGLKSETEKNDESETEKNDEQYIQYKAERIYFYLHFLQENLNFENSNKKEIIKLRIDLYENAKNVYINLKNYFKNVGFYDESAIFFIGEYRVRGKINKALGDQSAYVLSKRIKSIFHKIVFWKQKKQNKETNEENIPLNKKKISSNENKSADLLWDTVKNYLVFLRNRLLSATSLYGESVGRVMLTAFSIILVYATVYFRGGIIIQNESQSIHNFPTSLYFSIVTFTTLGYGDVHPISSIVMRLLAGSEAFLGAFLLAYFVVVVSRKIMR